MKFPQGEGSAVIHRKKNRPALQRRNILTVSLVSFFLFLIGNLLKSSSTRFLVVLFFIAFIQLSSLQNNSLRGFLLGLCLLSLVVLPILLLSMIAFSYLCRVPFSLMSATFSRSLPEPSWTQLFSCGVVFWAVCRARIRSVVSFFSSGLLFGLLSFVPIFWVSVLSNLQGRFHILSSFWGLFLGFAPFSHSVDFSYSEGSFFFSFCHGYFVRLRSCFSSFWFCSF